MAFTQYLNIDGTDMDSLTITTADFDTLTGITIEPFKTDPFIDGNMQPAKKLTGTAYTMLNGITCIIPVLAPVVGYLIMGAISDKKLSSAVGFRGICRKVLIFILVGIANVIDINVLGQVGVLRTAVIFFYISNEGLSLIENAAHLSLPIPGKLKEVLEQLHNRDEKDTDKEEK